MNNNSVNKSSFSPILFLFCSLCLAMLSSCRYSDDVVVDFANIEAAKGLKFVVMGQQDIDITNSLPENTYLPNGIKLAEYSEINEGSPYVKQSTSTNASGIIQELLKYKNQNSVTEIVGTYPSIDLNGDTIILSGKVLLPKNGRPKRMIVVSHYTICSNKEAPSHCFPLEGVLVKLGYGLIVPDYLGYGVTANQVHPYLVMELTAQNVIDMYLAVKPWLKAVNKAPLNDEICLMGYSQGGATTMAVQYLIENRYSSSTNPQQIKIYRVFAGGGPYDVKATFERFVNTNRSDYPVAVPLVVQGMVKGNKLNMELTDIMQPWLYEHLDEWCNSKQYTSAQINQLINTQVTSQMLTEEAMNPKSTKVAELYKAMTENSIVSYDWTPQAPVYMLHSMDDETVSYTNATNAKSKWKYANITYNFGHYGSHIKTCLRFIYSVQTLLQQDEEERAYYE